MLAAYDEILRTIKSDPIMIIGGYEFEGFDWKTTDPLTVQLTVLANRIDRAIRVAISKRYPDMLYPSEPSTLVKVWAEVEDGAFDIFHLMDETAIGAVRKVLPFDVGPLEGHNFKKWLKKLLGGDFSVLYDPRASVGTDPKPERPERGFVLRVQEILRAVRNRGKPAYALTMQSQTTASARKLASAVHMANPKILATGKGMIQTAVFGHVEKVVILMSENPGMTARDPRIRQTLRAMAEAVEVAAGTTEARTNKDLGKALASSHEVAQDIIAALTSKKLRQTWAELRQVLREIEGGQGPGQDAG
ncbi:hypothetical protein Ssi03_01140 [Sphaerisporangium siamense]|uniref:Uncharacterized protein n=1 Tax=Sphaerisporangium siamense TaxID=795645 RepID=A0A7W7DB90_9ACTN|nr:hypothetical protein [Sphaerisporangium siamense]MBB4703652.1 hypothetical protein [Sphaerisporangium siamense]GII82124.1 hypothetical protein Ssi03_01140 [Sphaerisporangium siamense]